MPLCTIPIIIFIEVYTVAVAATPVLCVLIISNYTNFDDLYKCQYSVADPGGEGTGERAPPSKIAYKIKIF